jgi:ATP-dependent protease Clp ATPase subunit
VTANNGVSFISHASVKTVQDLISSSTQPDIALLQLFTALLSAQCIALRIAQQALGDLARFSRKSTSADGTVNRLQAGQNRSLRTIPSRSKKWFSSSKL